MWSPVRTDGLEVHTTARRGRCPGTDHEERAHHEEAEARGQDSADLVVTHVDSDDRVGTAVPGSTEAMNRTASSVVSTNNSDPPTSTMLSWRRTSTSGSRLTRRSQSRVHISAQQQPPEAVGSFVDCDLERIERAGSSGPVEDEVALLGRRDHRCLPKADAARPLRPRHWRPHSPTGRRRRYGTSHPTAGGRAGPMHRHRRSAGRARRRPGTHRKSRRDAAQTSSGTPIASATIMPLRVWTSATIARAAACASVETFPTQAGPAAGKARQSQAGGGAVDEHGHARRIGEAEHDGGIGRGRPDEAQMSACCVTAGGHQFTAGSIGLRRLDEPPVAGQTEESVGVAHRSA